QDIDTSYRIGVLLCIDFISANSGYAFQGNGVKTINGGGQINFTGIKKIESFVNKYELNQNYPNPFNNSTKIKFSIQETTNIKLTIYNNLGKEVFVLFNNILSNGSYELLFVASSLASGVYYYKFEVTNPNNNLKYSETKKMIYLK
ncbi:MAG TPA: T9SS type A sorting domain-containing protein, partial [Ignavibacteria bacterium]